MSAISTARSIYDWLEDRELGKRVTSKIKDACFKKFIIEKHYTKKRVVNLRIQPHVLTLIFILN